MTVSGDLLVVYGCLLVFYSPLFVDFGCLLVVCCSLLGDFVCLCLFEVVCGHCLF